MVLTEETSNKLATYVAEKYEVAPDLSVEDKGLVGGSCYRMLTFHIAGPTRSLILYLSPDQRFLTPELLDIETHPAAERALSAVRTQADLSADPSPNRGSKNAPVTIVEFADFQCAFCKHFSEFVSDLGPDRDNKVRVIFKQFPLPNHSWSRRAALASICASLQGNDAFWRIHDFFFSHQDTLTRDNFDEEVAGFGGDGSLNMNQFQSCMNGHEAEGVLLRDQALARKYRVDGTPIVFINGRRTSGFKNAAELRAAVSLALASSTDAKTIASNRK